MTETPESGKRGCLGAFLWLLRGRRKTATKQPRAPYRLRDDFLSPAELTFYHALREAVGRRATVCAKVNLTDIFYVTRPHENFAARGRIAQKHLDFLVCHADSMQPLLGIELNDASHQRPERQQRDELVREVFAAAGLPLVEMPVLRTYVIDDLAAELAPYIAADPAVAQAPASADLHSGRPGSDKPPTCPKCGEPMVLRTASSGRRRGEQFYGCPNFPKCRQTRPADGAT